MNHRTFKATCFFVLMLFGSLSVGLVSAQTTGEVSYTEAEINASYRVTNPARSSLTDVHWQVSSP